MKLYGTFDRFNTVNQFHSTYTNAPSYYLHIVDFHKSPFQNTRHQQYTEQTLKVKSIMIPKIILHMFLNFTSIK